VKALFKLIPGWRRKKERKKERNSFWIFEKTAFKHYLFFSIVELKFRSLGSAFLSKSKKKKVLIGNTFDSTYPAKEKAKVQIN
jgi:hypothetical protein